MSDEQSAPEPELLPAKPKADATPPKRASQVQLSAFSRSGPLPDPREFRAYNEALPGAADRILTLAEEQAKHRMELERAAVLGGITQMRYGLACATIVVLATLAVTAYTASLGKGLLGLAAVLAEIAAIAGTFIYAANKNAQERTQKAKKRKADEDETKAIEN